MRRGVRHVLVLSAPVLAASLAAACGGYGSEGASGGSAADNAADNAKPPPDAVDGKPVDGVYVSAFKGRADGDGSPEMPFKSLKTGLEAGKARGKRVLVCSDTPIMETIEILDGVSAYGNYDCGAIPWKRTDKRTVIVAPASATGPTVVARGITQPTRLDGFEVVGPDLSKSTADPAPSSIAVLVRESKELTFASVTVRGGDAASGKNGEEAKANVDKGAPKGGAATTQRACNDAVCQSLPLVTGRAGGTSKCEVGPPGSPGGKGGDGAILDNGVWRADPFTGGGANVATPALAKGGTTLDLSTCTQHQLFGWTCTSWGTAGAAGAHGANGRNAAGGSFGVDGFVPADGTAGALGLPGQGGGGGGGAQTWMSSETTAASPQPPGVVLCATGAGGGAGGCGGIPGKPGRGGGASIAMMVVDSQVAVSQSLLSSGKGGAAGKGSLGTTGLAGGAAGDDTWAVMPVYDNTGKGGPAGAGGAGGNAGLSGHGAAGPSIALVFKGAKPILDAVELAPGPGGAGQPALSRGGQTALTAAPPGASKQEHAF